MSAAGRKRTLFDVALDEVCREYVPGSRSLNQEEEQAKPLLGGGEM